MGIVYGPRMMDEGNGVFYRSVIGRGNGKTRKILPQCQFFHHRACIMLLEVEPGPVKYEAASNDLC
jgi:hypothetical protein